MIQSKIFTLNTESGHWLGQVVITSDGMFSSITDYGNFSTVWRAFSSDTSNDFRKFLTSISTEYFAKNIFTSISYIVHTRGVEKACDRYAEKILPVLQEVLREDIKNNPVWNIDLQEIKEKITIIKNTKDIENIESILSYGELGKNIKEVLDLINNL